MDFEFWILNSFSIFLRLIIPKHRLAGASNDGFWILDLLIFLRFEISKHLAKDNGVVEVSVIEVHIGQEDGQ